MVKTLRQGGFLVAGQALGEGTDVRGFGRNRRPLFDPDGLYSAASDAEAFDQERDLLLQERGERARGLQSEDGGGQFFWGRAGEALAGDFGPAALQFIEPHAL